MQQSLSCCLRKKISIIVSFPPREKERERKATMVDEHLHYLWVQFLKSRLSDLLFYNFSKSILVQLLYNSIIKKKKNKKNFVKLIFGARMYIKPAKSHLFEILGDLDMYWEAFKNQAKSMHSVIDLDFFQRPVLHLIILSQIKSA